MQQNKAKILRKILRHLRDGKPLPPALAKKGRFLVKREDVLRQVAIVDREGKAVIEDVMVKRAVGEE
jgi:hypothetical protein